MPAGQRRNMNDKSILLIVICLAVPSISFFIHALLQRSCTRSFIKSKNPSFWQGPPIRPTVYCNTALHKIIVQTGFTNMSILVFIDKVISSAKKKTQTHENINLICLLNSKPSSNILKTKKLNKGEQTWRNNISIDTCPSSSSSRSSGYHPASYLLKITVSPLQSRTMTHWSYAYQSFLT